LSSLLVVLLLATFILAKPKATPPVAKTEPAKTDSNGIPIPPADAQYTLYCQAIGGAAHVELANAAKDDLIKLSGMKDWYIIHQEGESVIYYGFYRSINDPKDKKESERAQKERKTIENLSDGPGNKVFVHTFFVPVTEPDPAAPPEWNLLNSGGFWSLQIAAYKDSPRRKQAAVEAVRDARARGVQAFYYHGDTTSSVCIGAWPKSAMKGFDADAGVAADANQDVVVLPQPIPDDQRVEIRNRQGDRVRDMTPRIEAVDPSLIASMAQYPTHSVNGVVYVSRSKDPITGEMKAIEDPSFLVQIPKPAPSLLRAQQEPPTLVAPPTLGPSQGTPGAAKLKSIGQ